MFRALLLSLVRRIVPAGLLLLIVCPAARATNVVQAENAKPGTPGWQITNLAKGEIEGYASLTSVNRGQQISFYVNTVDPSYTLEIYRMGWYGGIGARRVLGPVQLPGIRQPIPTPDPATGLIECRWTSPYTLTIPDNANDPTDWASGIYLVRLTGSSGKQRYMIFVVRNDSRASDYLFVSAVTTYQAYNNWGGKSLYGYNSTGGVPARKVSFNRPYQDSGFLVYNGSGMFYGGWEYNMVRFLEREGYDVSYASSLDLHQNASLLANRKAYLSVGHDEYWSWQMRSNVLAARDRGVNMGFFSANTCYWQVRFEPSPATGAADRTMVGYKEAALTQDPLYLDGNASNDYLVTVRWRDAPVSLPEESFIGTMYISDQGSTPVGQLDLVVSNATHWVFDGTGLKNGDHLKGLLGYEFDASGKNAPANVQVLAHSPYTSGSSTVYSDMTVYTAASGATVFATGTIQWSWGLDDFNAPALRPALASFAAQQTTRNVLAKLANGSPKPRFELQPPGQFLGTAKPGEPLSMSIPIRSLDSSDLMLQMSCKLSGSSGTATCDVTPKAVNLPAGGTQPALLTVNTVGAVAGTPSVTVTASDSATAESVTLTYSIQEYAVSAPTLEVISGGSGTVSVTLASLNGYNGTVNLACDSAKFAGNLCSLSPADPVGVNAGSVSTISLTESAALGTAAGPYSVVLKSNDASIPAVVRSTPISVKVYDFNISTASSSVSLPAGQSATINVLLTSYLYPFPQEIRLGCSGLPPGFRCLFSQSEIAAGTMTSTVQVTIQTSGRTLAAIPSQMGVLGMAGMIALAAVLSGSLRRRGAGCALILLAAALGGCGGIGGKRFTPGSPESSTSSGTYTVIIRGSTTGSVSSAERSASVTLIVQ